MSLYIYDEALVEKLRKWTNDTNLHIYSPDETKRLFQVISDETADSPIKLPIICLQRMSSFQVMNMNKKPTTFNGFKLRANTSKAVELNCIPIKIDYQLDVYTRYMKEADEYIRNIIFNIVNYNKMLINIPYYDENFTHTSTIRMGNDVQDNSNIPERLIPGQFTRYSLDIYIDDAYLWDIKNKSIKKIVDGPTQLQISIPPLTRESVEVIEPLDVGSKINQ